MVKYPSRDLTLLDPALKGLCEQFVGACAAQGVKVVVTQTHRSGDYQNQLFAQGRTQGQLDVAGVDATAQPGLPKVTNAKAGSSAHEYSKGATPWARAFDIAIQNADGSLNWDASTQPWKTAGAIGVKLGLDWGGAWTGFQDPPHFQLKNWRTLP